MVSCGNGVVCSRSVYGCHTYTQVRATDHTLCDQARLRAEPQALCSRASPWMRGQQAAGGPVRRPHLRWAQPGGRIRPGQRESSCSVCRGDRREKGNGSEPPEPPCLAEGTWGQRSVGCLPKVPLWEAGSRVADTGQPQIEGAEISSGRPAFGRQGPPSPGTHS